MKLNKIFICVMVLFISNFSNIIALQSAYNSDKSRHPFGRITVNGISVYLAARGLDPARLGMDDGTFEKLNTKNEKRNIKRKQYYDNYRRQLGWVSTKNLPSY